MVNSQLAWYVAGPVLGLCVVAARLLFNARLGVTGGVSELETKLRQRRLNFDWRGWCAIGVLLGGVGYGLVAGPAFEGYGWMTDTFSGSEQWAIVPILLVSGVLIGYGAKVAGGCTSGNGLSGTAQLSPGALVATCTFFATAIVVAVIVEALI